MCFICVQFNQEIINSYDAEVLFIEHRHTIGDEHAKQGLEQLRGILESGGTDGGPTEGEHSVDVRPAVYEDDTNPDDPGELEPDEGDYPSLGIDNGGYPWPDGG